MDDMERTIGVRDLMPMFTVRIEDGTLIRYQDLWQRRNLVLVTLPEDDSGAVAYARSLGPLLEAAAASDNAVVITRTPVEGVPRPGVVVADQWGEVHYVAAADSAAALPSAGELAEWLHYVRIQCPECQGETR